MDQQVAVTGIGIEIPGIKQVKDLLGNRKNCFQPKPFEPETILGKKGLRYKDRATKYALCAAKKALDDGGLPFSAKEMPRQEEFGVAVSSNFGNLETICRNIETIRSEGAMFLSSMDLPNASSNVIASTIAIRFGMKAVNLMLCNGATSGIDALHLAANSIRTGRAEQMIVVGVETAGRCARELIMNTGICDPKSENEMMVLDGAAALILESAQAAGKREAAIYGHIGDYHYSEDHLFDLGKNGERPDLWIVPDYLCSPQKNENEGDATFFRDYGANVCSIIKEIGEPYGALGILQAISACHWLSENNGKMAFASSGVIFESGFATIRISKVAS